MNELRRNWEGNMKEPKKESTNGKELMEKTGSGIKRNREEIGKKFFVQILMS